MKRKGEDTIAMKRRRMPYVAKIKRDDPYRLVDRGKIEAMLKRIAVAGEHFSIAGWRENAGFLLFHFRTWAKARAHSSRAWEFQTTSISRASGQRA